MSELGRTRDLDLTEAEAKNRISKKFEIQRNIITDEEKFVQDLSGVITYNQILRLDGLNREFARHIWQRRREENKQ